MSQSDDFHQLIDSAYRVILEPDRYDSMMELWQSFVSTDIDEGQRTILQMHFSRAEQMMDAVSTADHKTRPLNALLNGFTGPSLVFDKQFKIVMANQAANDIADDSENRSLEETPILNPDILGDLKTWCLGKPSQLGSVFFARDSFMSKGQKSGYMIVTRITFPQFDFRQNRQEPQPHFLLTSGSLHFDKRTTEALQNAFSLSDAEVAIVEGLAKGKSPNEVAEDRGASINTIRTQVRSALAKFDAKNIAELVGQVTGFVANFNASISIARHLDDSLVPAQLFREGEILLPSGRRLSYVDQGSLNGKPVLFIHGMLFGRRLTTDAAEAASNKGWRVIAPSRPGFGESDIRQPDTPEGLLDGVARDIVHLMDHLGLESVFAAGLMGGSCYAIRLAQRVPQRIKGVLLLNHIPIWKPEYANSLPIRQRIIAQTSIKTPPLFRFICQSGATMIKSGFANQFLEALTRSSPADNLALQNSQVRDVVMEGLQHTVLQGVEGFCRDAPYTVTDWSDMIRKLEHPTTVLVGGKDQVNPAERIEGHMDLFQNARFDKIDDAGQFLIWSHWPRFFNALEALEVRTG